MAHKECDVDSLLPFMMEHTVAWDGFLFRQGNSANDIYYLSNEKSHILEIDTAVKEGHLIVEIGMLSPNKQRSQSIKCLEDCLFLLISEEKVFQVYTQNPEFGLYLIKMAVDRLLTNVKNKTAIAMEWL